MSSNSSIDLTSILSNQTWLDLIKPDQKSLFLSNSHLQELYLDKVSRHKQRYIYAVYINKYRISYMMIQGLYNDVNIAKQILIDIFSNNPDVFYYDAHDSNVIKHFSDVHPYTIMDSGDEAFIYKLPITDEAGAVIPLNIVNYPEKLNEIGTKIFEIRSASLEEFGNVYGYSISYDTVNEEKGIPTVTTDDLYIVTSDDEADNFILHLFDKYGQAKQYYDKSKDELEYRIYKYVLNSPGFFLDGDMFSLPEPVLTKLEEKHYF